jgi:hypothetical protein
MVVFSLLMVLMVLPTNSPVSLNNKRGATAILKSQFRRALGIQFPPPLLHPTSPVTAGTTALTIPLGSHSIATPETTKVGMTSTSPVIITLMNPAPLALSNFEIFLSVD